MMEYTHHRQGNAHLPDEPWCPLPQTSARRYQDIPEPLTPLFGREEVQQRARALLMRQEVRLLTFAGLPGVGKTRLAQAVSHDLCEEFSHGVCFLPLEHIATPDCLIPTLAQRLGVDQSTESPLVEQLKTFLREQHILLVLDNFEHILSAAHLLTELLTACPRLKMLVTSRAILHLEGEYVFSVPALAVPDRHQPPGSQTVEQTAAVDLFVERARVICPEFELTQANAPTIARICTLLDGLPLAITLIAARCRLFSPDVLLSRLEPQRFALLTQSTRDAPAHQKSMHQAISWSYHLLSDEEQTLFRRLAVFAGGCTLEAAEVICTALEGFPLSMLDGMNALLDNSLLTEGEDRGQEPRFMMATTLRAYGWNLLAASGELPACRDAHAAYYLRLALEAEAALRGPEQNQWRERLEQERDNLWSALHWLLEQEHGEDAFQLSIALQPFWPLQGRPWEGEQCMQRALQQPISDDAPQRPQAFAAPPDPPQSSRVAPPGGLTPREVEVLHLLAMGLSNRRIAEQLVLSPHTVGVHIQSIYSKLHINSRSAATRFALEHHLT